MKKIGIIIISFLLPLSAFANISLSSPTSPQTTAFTETVIITCTGFVAIPNYVLAYDASGNKIGATATSCNSENLGFGSGIFLTTGTYHFVEIDNQDSWYPNSIADTYTSMIADSHFINSVPFIINADTPVTPDTPAVTRDDTANTVTGMATGMEYKLDAADYVTYGDGVAFGLLDFSSIH